MEITEDQFQMFESVRRSGQTNMLDARRVGQLANLTRAQVIAILKWGVVEHELYWSIWQHAAVDRCRCGHHAHLHFGGCALCICLTYEARGPWTGQESAVLPGPWAKP